MHQCTNIMKPTKFIIICVGHLILQTPIVFIGVLPLGNGSKSPMTKSPITKSPMTKAPMTKSTSDIIPQGKIIL